MSELPQDILAFNLLPRLPAKSVVRFMCVCKEWNSFLRKPQFARIHLNHLNKLDANYYCSLDHQKLLVQVSPTSGNYYLDSQFYSVDLEGNARRCNLPVEALLGAKIFGSCDGLVCLGIVSSCVYSRSSFSGNLVLWNPSTGDYKKLSDSGSSYAWYSHDDHGFGFCFDSWAKDYKVIHMAFEVGIYIYSLMSDSWRQVVVDATNFKALSAGGGSISCSNESLYMLPYYGHGQRLLCCFDLKTEKFSTTSLPAAATDEISEYLKAVEGYVYLIITGCYEPVSIWRMEEKKKGVWVNILAFRDVSHCFFLKPICVTKDEKLVSILRGKNNLKSNLIFTYNKRTGCAEENLVSIRGIRDVFITGEKAYTQTLVSPNHLRDD